MGGKQKYKKSTTAEKQPLKEKQRPHNGLPIVVPNTVEPRLPGLVGTTRNSLDNQGSKNMNINEEQNRAKLIKLRKRHLIAKKTLLQIIWNTLLSASSFLSFMERMDRLRWRS